MKCPRCKSEERTKNGFNKGKQRYKCKNCGCNYTLRHGRGYAPEIREKAIAYYL